MSSNIFQRLRPGIGGRLESDEQRARRHALTEEMWAEMEMAERQRMERKRQEALSTLYDEILAEEERERKEKRRREEERAQKQHQQQQQQQQHRQRKLGPASSGKGQAAAQRRQLQRKKAKAAQVPKHSRLTFPIPPPGVHPSCVQEAVFESLAHGTRQTYFRLVAEIVDRGFTPNLAGLCDYLSSGKATMSWGSIKSYTSAIRKHYDAQGYSETPGERRTLAACIETYKRRHPELRPQETGAISRGDLVNIFKLGGFSRQERDAMWVMWGGAFRHGQITAMRPMDFTHGRVGKASRKSWVYIAARQKNNTMTTVASETHELHPLANAILTRVINSTPSNKHLMFPWWNEELMRQKIRASCQLIGLSGKLKWCVHSMRHGGAGDAVASAATPEEGIAAAQARGGWLSENIAAFYGRTNEQRLVQRGEAAKTHKTAMQQIMKAGTPWKDMMAVVRNFKGRSVVELAHAAITKIAREKAAAGAGRRRQREL